MEQVSDSSVEHKVYEVLSNTSSDQIVPIVAIDFFMAIYIYKSISSWIILTWFCIASGFLFFRRYSILRLKNDSRYNIGEKLKLIQYIVFVNALIQAFPAIFFPYIPFIDRITISFLLIAICIGSLIIYSGYKPLLYAALFPITFMLFLFLFISMDAITDWENYIFFLLLIFFMSVIRKYATVIFSTLQESFNIRKEMSQLNQRLSVALEEADNALEEADKANKSKTRFLAAASHDLRQPLHALSAYSAALRLQDLDKNSAQITENVITVLDILSLQFNALFDISKLDTGVLQKKCSKIDLRQFLLRTCDEYQEQIGRKHLQLKLNICEGYIFSDPALLDRIITNLLSNAVKNTQTGSINVELIKDFNTFDIVISDTGVGIPEQDMEKIFDEFYQLDNPSRDRSKGLGLGLSIVKRLCELLDMKIAISSETGIGTRVSVSTRPSHYISDPGKYHSDQPKYPLLNRLTILIVDDDEWIRHAMSVMLTSHGMEVLLAKDTRDALEVARNSKPDVALVDFRLATDDSGLNCQEKLKALYPDLLIIIVTGDINNKELCATNSPPLTVLYKPVSYARLSVEISRLQSEAKSRR